MEIVVISKAESAENPAQVRLHITTPICGLLDLARALTEGGGGVKAPFKGH